MDYIRQMNAFVARTTEKSLCASAYALYLHLFGLNNTLHWAEWFRATDTQLATLTNLSINTVRQAKKELQEKGFIDVRVGGHKTPSEYHIIPLSMPTDNVQNLHDKPQDNMQKLHAKTDSLENNHQNLHDKSTDNVQNLHDKPQDNMQKLIAYKNVSKTGVTKTKNTIRTPYGVLMERARERCPSLPAPQKLTAGREAALRRVWKELGEDMTAWDAFLSRVEASDFLTGRKKDWRATFDWILKPANFAKIQEGNYDNRKGAASDAGTCSAQHGAADRAAEHDAWLEQLEAFERYKESAPRPWDVQPDGGGDRASPGGDCADRSRTG
jgi:hypothetical protein